MALLRGEEGILETTRLRLRQLTPEDAEFILRLLNEPSFIGSVGDKGVRTLADARSYILNGPIASYGKFGFGLWLVGTKASDLPIGICGLLKRDVLEAPDIGYALVPEHWSQGYAFESASGVMSYAQNGLGLHRILAITGADNQSSIRVLQKLGFEFERMFRLPEAEANLKLFAHDGSPGE